jgi:hypothetical protein
MSYLVNKREHFIMLTTNIGTCRIFLIPKPL